MVLSDCPHRISSGKHPRAKKKSLGQVFLAYAPAARALVSALDLQPDDWVLEIGPGRGALTRRLLETGCRVTAVEIDVQLADRLRCQLQSEKLEIVTADFMEFDLSGFSKVKVVGNLPYNLSSQIILRLVESPSAWQVAVLTTQREFARRVLAAPGSKAYGALSVFCSVRVTGERVLNLPPEWFRPKPAVVSTAFRLKVREHPLFQPRDNDWFRRVVRAAFCQRRKTLVNSLSVGLGMDKHTVARVLLDVDIDPETRAETLTPEQFYVLSEVLA